MANVATTQAVTKATSDIAATYATAGERGLILFALLLVIFLLLVRDFLKDWMIRSVAREQAAANRKVADAMQENTIHLSLLMSAAGVAEYQRKRDRGELPKGALPE